MIPFEQRLGAHDESRRAKAAVNRAGVNIGLLDNLSYAIRGSPFDGQHAFSEGLYRQHGAGIDRPPVHDHRAGAALGAVARALCSGQCQFPAQIIEQRCVFVNITAVKPPVYSNLQQRFFRIRHNRLSFLYASALRAFRALISFGRNSYTSATMPISAEWKMGASGSRLIATIVFEELIPTRCWIAPDTPQAT